MSSMPMQPKAPPSLEEWPGIVAEAERFRANPYTMEGRQQLAEALTRRGYRYEARTLLSGKIVAILGREYFPPKVPSCSVHDPDCGEHGITLTPVSPSPATEGWLPASVGIDPAPALSARPRWKRDHFVASLDQGSCVMSPWGYAIFARDGHYVRDFCHNDGPLIAWSGIVPTVTKVEGTVAVLAQSWSYAVYHWNTESLPRLHLLRLAGLLEQVDRIVVREIQDWHYEYLELLNIPREKLLPVGQIAHIQADRLLVCSNVEEANWMVYPHHLEAEPWVCALLASLCPDPTPNRAPTERIYISRAKAGSRRLWNENELRPFLERNGFRTVFFEDMSLKEKAETLREAAVVVSAAGAGLSHIPFMRPGSNCIIMYSDDNCGSAFRDICANSGVVHIHSISPSSGRFFPAQMLDAAEHLREQIIDIKRLAELMLHCGIELPYVPEFDTARTLPAHRLQ